MPKARKATAPRAHEEAIRSVALGYPEATEDLPWGHSAFKVRGKAFVFAGVDDGVFHLSVKLPVSNAIALAFPFAEPTGYGLGKAGWVSASFGPGDELPLGLLRAWIDESYRALAPKRLVATLDPIPATGPTRPPARSRSGPRTGAADRPGTRRSPGRSARRR